MRKILAVLAISAVSVSAFATLYNFDPGVTLSPFTNNSNDGYSSGRGIFFQASVDSTVDRAGFFNGFGIDQQFTMTMWSAASDGSNLYVSNLGSFDVVPGAIGDAWADGTFSSAINLSAGSFYHLEVTSNSSFDTNWFYNWNGPAVDISGVFEIQDGSQAGGLGNTVAPALRVNANPVPEPGTMVALSIGALALLRRRRKVA